MYRVFKVWLTNLIVLLLFIIDRIFKLYFINNPGADRVFISNILSLHLEINPGIAFGINLPQIISVPIIVIIIIILVYISIKAYQEKDQFLYSSIALILTGAFSNLFDRIRFGAVIDYIDVEFFTAFNLADAMITAGVIILLIDRFKVLARK